MKASNIFQNKGVKSEGGKGPFIKGIGSPFKKRKGCGPQRLGSPIKMGMEHKSPMQFNAGLKKAAAEGKLDNNPKFKAAVENSPAKKYGHKSPAKKYKSAAQRKAVHASKADGGAGHPDKKKSPAKKYKKSPAKKYKSSPAKAHCKSPAKIGKKISEKRAKKKVAKGKGEIQYQVGGGYYHNKETGERGYKPGYGRGEVHNRGRYVSNKGKSKKIR
tara:strand:- start:4094 stop:4741 length:648 start_codon:yes stop_codon:yes gene_type:complete